MRVATPGTATVRVSLLPTHPLADGRGLRRAVGLDDQPPRLPKVDAPVESRAWAQGVLDETLTATAKCGCPRRASKSCGCT